MSTLAPAGTKKPKRRVTLKLRLHPGQREVNQSTARFKVVACGRQWGKTKYAAAWAFKRALEGKKGWWVAPDSIVADVGWDALRKMAAQIPGVEIRESAPRTITTPSGGWLQVKGAHLPGKLRGRTLDFIVVDEAAFIDDGSRWNSELRPTLAVKGGTALFISTFNGENWFFDLYQRGQDADYPEWESWRKPSVENPYFPPSELELARATTPKAEFEQEYLANPLVYVGAVFPGEKVQEATEYGQAPVYAGLLKDVGAALTGGAFFAGLDWGYTNATAFEVCFEARAMGNVAWIDERSWVATQLDTRVETIVELARAYRLEAIYADAAGATENAKLADALDRAGLTTALVGVPFGKFKETGIKVRRWYLESALEAMGPNVPELIRTTKRYRYKEGTEDPLKEDDHPVDAATAFYASRRQRIVEDH